MQYHVRQLFCVWVIAALWMPASFAGGAEPANAPFDGEWTLDFRVHTRPGGESFTTRQGMSVSPYQFQFHSVGRPFRFEEDRSLQLDVRENASLRILSTSRFGDVTLWDRQSHFGRLHLEGSGMGEGKDRTVKLAIRWGCLAGTGFTSDSFGTSSTYREQMSEDGTQITLSNEAGTQTLPFELWKSNWELKPISIEQREVSPDVIVETATYSGRRGTRVSPLDPGGFSPPLPVTEEIELKQVRQLELVPRG